MMLILNQILCRQHCPMLLAQYQHAVTRVDAVESFSFSDFLEVFIFIVCFCFLVVFLKELNES